MSEETRDLPQAKAIDILVVEDEELNLKLITRILEREQFAIRYSRTAEEAFEMLQVTRPRVILMDIKLPGMDGLEAIRKLKAEPTLAQIPVVVVSAYAMEEDRIRALQAGCSAYMSKPFDRQRLVETVRAFLQ